MILNKVITKELKEDILKGDSDHIKDGMIIFDQIVFQGDNNGACVRLYNKGINLVNFHDKYYVPGCSLTFQLVSGTMKVELH